MSVLKDQADLQSKIHLANADVSYYNINIIGIYGATGNSDLYKCMYS